MKLDQAMHERLCAFALGEVDAAQRIEMEHLLAESAELRAELETLEHTIGLVRENVGASERLSPAAEAALLQAVNPEPRTSAWYASGWMRMAAGFLVVGGSALFLRSLFEQNRAHMAPECVARLELEEQRKAGQPLGSVGGLVPATEDAKNAAPKAELGLDADLDKRFGAPDLVREPTGGKTASSNSIAAVEAKKDAGAVPVPATQLGELRGDHMWRDTAALAPGAAPTTPGISRENLEVQLQTAGDGSRDDRSSLAYKSKADIDAVRERGTYRGAGDTSPAGGGGGGLAAGTAPAPKPAEVPALKRVEQERLAQATDQLVARRAPGLAGNEKRLDAPLAAGRPAAGAEPAQTLAKEQRPANTDSFFLGTGAPASAPEPTAEQKVRELLDRADRDGVERLALLQDSLNAEGRAKFRGLGYVGPDSEDEVRLSQLYFKLSPEERQRVLEVECQGVLDRCRRLPNERPRDMFFRYWGDNPFEFTALDPLSTFAADVDTASYALARRYLVEGKLPEKAQIRTEEFVNYFKADVPAPTKNTFAIRTDLAPSRFAQPANSLWTLRVVVRGEELAKEERKPLHLVCVIDCSGSMKEQNRMETVKDTLRLLMTQLNAADQIGLVAFSTEARQILPLTSVANRGLIEAAIAQLQPDGWTNSEAGLKLGYETALAGLDAQATNRVVFLSDGVANKGVTDPVQLSNSLRPIREKGVYLNTIGVGMNNHDDALLEQLADKGDGMCSYVDDMREAKRVMLDNFMGSLETIARDVKIQVEFDPAQVARYRLLGYENRAVADADFRNDKVDAGEIGAGHQVTALYELERNLGAASEKPLATVRLRWKAPRLVNGPANEEATEIAQELRGTQATSFEGADAGYRRAVIVGQFAEFLRRSVHARGRSFDELLAEAHKLEAQLPQDTDFHEFVVLAERSKQLVLVNLPACDELCQAIDAYRTWQIQCAQAERLNHERQQQLVEDLARQNREMEEHIRELLRRRLESLPR